ncbi:HD domain-containing protein [Apilactobacillus micheneri]|uniref:HD domain-containing protein n=1 Tax=Apilactobacillus micheneri TaxID=1899430 RepID=A0A9Q8MTF4_9LACO|nr:HD domain-containing protein [Apilactobacillus micheneri]TPR38788.1 HD domain-containing protein [Apilactobacillus micheneri]TPR41322.1 HD domain-containing protein [Apilactobacillus micheneri]TPR43016.1 HD domain-containing protein [Apilactobacillus micheneri]TPR43964.1 HD domain-containing protein [Apilactobacillus micheneri]TPR48590.1 HD domain-containing protein [Apilactobacillus micheneri]
MKFTDKLLPREKVFRDPVHDYIYVQHQVILDLINTKEMQRLRRVKQLGASSFTFHGAEHSRFTHSLGVYEITRRICDLFLRNYPTENPGDGLWDDSERLVALCAALLHDIGHGAYSHTFEHIFHTNHEMITQEIITSPKTEVNKVLRNVDPEFPKQVAAVINHTYSNPQVVQMISSQCDADRMDYLLRDAYNTGASYGNFDLTRILRVMRPYSGGICFDISGMHAVEDYIISRLQMYMQVYFHPVSRSMEVILSHLLKRAKQLADKMPTNDSSTPYLLMPFFQNNFDIDDYLKLDDGVLNTYFIHWVDSKDSILSDLADRFINRRPLKSVEFNSDTKKLIPKLQELIKQVGFAPEYYTDTNNSFDLPYDAYDPKKKHHATQIELRRPDGTMVELSKVSRLVNAVTGKQLGDERFFFPKEMLNSANNIEIFQPIYEEFQKHIKNNQLI